MSELRFEDIKARLEEFSRLRAGELSPVEKARILDETCGENPDLRRQAEALLDRQDTKTISRLIGPYRLERELGRGGMGAVYLASRADDQYKKRVAIKLLHSDDQSEEVLLRFRNERQILANLDHPHIAQLHDGGVTPDGAPYFVMEYIQHARPIDAFCRDRRLDVRERLRLFLDACAAVQYAHRFLIIHRDLKPGNILVSSDGEVKLMDFGIAKNLLAGFQAGDSPNTIGTQPMTPAYASPEQIRGEAISTASDVYSLGVILYELLTGRLPFVGWNSLHELMEAIARTDPQRPSVVVHQTGKHPDLETRAFADWAGEPSPQKLSRRLRGDLDWIVLMALRKDPSRRYGSVEQLAEDIRLYLEGRPVRARKDAVWYTFSKYVQRNRYAVAATALLFVALAGGIVATRIEQQRTLRHFQAVRELANSFLFEVHDAVRDLPGSTPTRSLIIKRALTYLDRLAKDASGDPSLQSDLADAYAKVSELQFFIGSANLGDLAGAIESARKSLQIREAVDRARESHPQALRKLAAAHQRIAELSDLTGDTASAAHSRERALVIREKLAHENPTREIRAELASSYRSMGDRRKDDGHPEEALTLYRRALATRESLLQEDPSNRELRKSYSMEQVRIADVLGSPGDVNLHRYQETMEFYKQALAIREQLLRENPGSPVAQRDVANVYQRMGKRELCPIPDAIEHTHRALNIYRGISQADPANTEVRRDIAVSNLQLGDLYREAGQVEKAVARTAEALTIYKAIYERDPRNMRAQDDLSGAWRATGAALLESKRIPEAIEHLRTAARLEEDLASRNPANARYRQRLAEIYLRFGRAQRAGGGCTAALDTWKAGQSLLASLRKEGKLSPNELEEADQFRKEMSACGQ